MPKAHGWTTYGVHPVTICISPDQRTCTQFSRGCLMSTAVALRHTHERCAVKGPLQFEPLIRSFGTHRSRWKQGERRIIILIAIIITITAPFVRVGGSACNAKLNGSMGVKKGSWGRGRDDSETLEGFEQAMADRSEMTPHILPHPQAPISTHPFPFPFPFPIPVDLQRRC